MNVYEIITDRILKEMESGTLPWVKGWKSALGEEPANLKSKATYRGLNRFLLSQGSYARPYYVTYNQATELGGTVKKGEHGMPVIFWKKGTYTAKHDDGTESEEKSFLLRYYTVFNIEQCEGLDKYLPEVKKQPTNEIPSHEKADQIVLHYPNAPKLQHRAGDRAFYRPSEDLVVMPEKTQFKSQAGYYSTLFHELTHSTGHESRLKRPTLLDALGFGDTNYSKEELVAEMGAAFLCGEAGIENEAALKNSAAYIDGWRRTLKQDSKIVVHAAAQAQKAADYILDRKYTEA